MENYETVETTHDGWLAPAWISSCIYVSACTHITLEIIHNSKMKNIQHHYITTKVNESITMIVILTLHYVAMKL